ncbi:MAG TPA: YfiR family protein [Terriglobia bacterium]|nr:YfiR family protein [Terriglobia bacterium]
MEPNRLNEPGEKRAPAAGIIACFLMMALPCASVRAQQPSEYQVKAAFVYNFARFVDWPEGTPEQTFVIGILGEDPLGRALEAVVNQKTVNGRPIVVRRIASAAAGRDCRVVFISASEQRRVPAILDVLKGSAVLTVGESEGFAKQGGMINFIMEDDRVRFEVNVDAAEQARLKISSRLLRLARIVKGSGG